MKSAMTIALEKEGPIESTGVQNPTEGLVQDDFCDLKNYPDKYESNVRYNRRLMSAIKKYIKEKVQSMAEDRRAIQVSDLGECNCEHFPEVIVNEEVNGNVDTIYDLIFGSESSFMVEVCTRKGMKNVRMGEMMRDSQNNKYRYLCHHYPNAFWSRTASNSVCLNFSPDDVPALHYSVFYSNKTSGVPFASTFVVQMQFCLAAISPTVTRMKISWRIQFIGKVWAVRGHISSTARLLSERIMREYPIVLNEMLGNLQHISNSSGNPPPAEPIEEEKVAPELPATHCVEANRVEPSPQQLLAPRTNNSLGLVLLLLLPICLASTKMVHYWLSAEKDFNLSLIFSSFIFV